MTAQKFTHPRRLRLVALATLAFAAFFAAPATAESRVLYTSPDATSNWPSCDTPESPCELRWLAEDYADKGDTIVLLPGSYGTASHPMEPLDIYKALTLRGEVGQPRPKLYFGEDKAGGVAASGISMCGNGSLIHLEISGIGASSYPFFFTDICAEENDPRGTIENVVATGGALGCEITSAIRLVRNSVCRSVNGGYGLKLHSSEGRAYTLRNVTAVATGEPSGGKTTGLGIIATGNDSTPTLTVSVVNTIAHAESTQAVDLMLSGKSAIQALVDHSNFRSTHVYGESQLLLDPKGSNQSAEPKFIDPTVGDYRQALGSPTIDAGVVSPDNGEFDIDGDERTIGESTDIGADELAMTFRSDGSNADPDSGSTESPDPGAQTGTSGTTDLRSVDPPDLGTLTITGSLKRRAWRAAHGTKLRINLNGNANVRAQLRRRRGERFVKAGKLALGTLTAGRHSVRLRSPLPSGRKLRPGRYRLVLRATVAGTNASSEPIRFRVLPPRR